jgi:tetratricopeptide (TPR) repeat protein
MISDRKGSAVSQLCSRFLAAIRVHPRGAVLASIVIVAGLTTLGAHLWAAYHCREGDRLVDRQDFVEAYAHYVKSLKIWRWSAQTHLIAGRTARRASMDPEAEHHFESCLRLSGRDSARSAAVALERLLIQAQRGDLRDIEDLLWGKVKQEAPEAQLILEALAHGYLRMMRFGPAMECLRMILERDPDNADALYNRGWLAERSDGSMDPVKDYRRALELRPDRDDFRLSLAQVLGKNQPAEAIGYFEQLIAKQPDNPDVILGLAHAYQAAGLLDGPERAADLIDALLQMDPDNSRALTEKGIVLVANGNVTQGEELLRRALANDPVNVDAHFQLSSCLRQQPGRDAEADAELEIFKRIRADRLRLAQIASREMSKKPFDANLHYEMGMIWYRNGKIDLGLRWLRSAYELNPTHEPTLRALADHFKRAGDTSNAQKYYLDSNQGDAK